MSTTELRAFTTACILNCPESVDSPLTETYNFNNEMGCKNLSTILYSPYSMTTVQSLKGKKQLFS